MLRPTFARTVCKAPSGTQDQIVVTVSLLMPFISKSWQSLHREAAVARSVKFARGLRPWNLFLFVVCCQFVDVGRIL
jgi:hypothetical protein